MRSSFPEAEVTRSLSSNLLKRGFTKLSEDDTRVINTNDLVAKRIRELLPPLPSGVRSTFIQYLDAIQMLEKDDVSVKISDISDALNLPRPGVTRTVKEMEEKGFLQKIASPDDGRVTYITITEAGKELHQKFDAQYFDMLAPYMDEISEEDAQNMIRTIEKFYQIMRERREYDGSR